MCDYCGHLGGFLAIHHYKIIFAVEIYMSMTAYGRGSDCAESRHTIITLANFVM